MKFDAMLSLMEALAPNLNSGEKKYTSTAKSTKCGDYEVSTRLPVNRLAGIGA